MNKTSSDANGGKIERKSPYTDQNKPPYFRLDEVQRGKYQQAIAAFLSDERTLDLFPKEQKADKWDKEPSWNIPRGMPYWETWKKPGTPSHRLTRDEVLDEAMQRMLALKEAQALPWPPQSIGPVRRLYYRALLLHGADQRLTRYLPSLHPEWQSGGHMAVPRDASPGSVVFLNSLRVEASEWLLHDFFLNDVLTTLGLTWETVERAMAEAFQAAMANAFAKATPDGTAPKIPDSLKSLFAVEDPYGFLTWEAEMVRWDRYARHADKIAHHAESLRTAFGKKIPTHNFDEVFDEVEVALTPAPWMRSVVKDMRVTVTANGKTRPQTRTVSAMPDYVGVKSPLARAVNRGLDDAFDGITTEAISASVPDFVKHIHRARVEDGERVQEYWMLLADILYHLPLVRGLPAIPRLGGEPRLPSALTGDALRQSVATARAADARREDARKRAATAPRRPTPPAEGKAR